MRTKPSTTLRKVTGLVGRCTQLYEPILPVHVGNATPGVLASRLPFDVGWRAAQNSQARSTRCGIHPTQMTPQCALPPAVGAVSANPSHLWPPSAQCPSARSQAVRWSSYNQVPGKSRTKDAGSATFSGECAHQIGRAAAGGCANACLAPGRGQLSGGLSRRVGTRGK